MSDGEQSIGANRASSSVPYGVTSAQYGTTSTPYGMTSAPYCMATSAQYGSISATDDCEMEMDLSVGRWNGAVTATVVKRDPDGVQNGGGGRYIDYPSTAPDDEEDDEEDDQDDDEEEDDTESLRLSAEMAAVQQTILSLTHPLAPMKDDVDDDDADRSMTEALTTANGERALDTPPPPAFDKDLL